MKGPLVFQKEDRKSLLDLARKAIGSYLSDCELPATTDFKEPLSEILSCFVSLHTKDGDLRGCIGDIEPYEALAANVVRNAVCSAFEDPRFPPLEAEELDDIVIEISVLTRPGKISSPDEFIPGKHGIILECRGAAAVFLPQVAPEQGWDRETTLAHLSMKAGLDRGAWRSRDAKFQIFEAIVFSEK